MENELSETILLDRDFDKTREITGVELLKQQFGDSQLSRCDVFFKDLRDSERYIRNYRESLTRSELKGFRYRGLTLESLSLLQVSSGYWPINSDNFFNFPEKFQNIFDKMLNDYKKSNLDVKKIKLHNNLGSVKLKLKFPSGVAIFKCQPVQAILISYFDKKTLAGKEDLSLKFLADSMGAKEAYIRPKMQYWVHRGIIVEHNNVKEMQDGYAQTGQMPNYTYSIVKDYHCSDLMAKELQGSMMEEESEGGPIQTRLEAVGGWQDEFDTGFTGEEHESICRKALSFKVADDQESGNLSLEKKILGILINNGPKNLNKLYYITEMLKWNIEHSFSWSESMLQERLDAMVKKKMVTCAEGVYNPVFV